MDLCVDKHIEFIVKFCQTKDSIDFLLSEHFQLSGLYWCICALHLVRAHDTIQQELPETEVLKLVSDCQNEDGGYGGAPGHDSHMLYTLSAVQIHALYRRLDLVDVQKITTYVCGLQQPTGCFCGDKWGEVDSRFTYCAFNLCSLIGTMDQLDAARAVQYILQCTNFDGGYGQCAGGETHAGQIFCCIGSLTIARALHRVNKDVLGWWLSERQLPNGGLNGRPQKLQDVCYSWWCLSSLSCIDRLHWIDVDALVQFILVCQDTDDGGISDRADDLADVFHTYFGIAALGIIGHDLVEPIDSAFALPVRIMEYVNNEFLGGGVGAAVGGSAGHV